MFPSLRASGQTPGTGDLPSRLDFFERKIRPVLVERCYSCHGPDAAKPKGGFRLDSREGLLRGGGRGPAIVPGDPGKSLLLRAIRRDDPELKMPPQGALTAEQVADFAAWIAAGAHDPRAGKSAGEAPASASAPPARKLWALEPLRDPSPPPVADSSWSISPIDRFILAALEERGLRPAPPADRRTLIRRAYHDLHGLPPTAEEVEAFERDPSPRAYQELVDHLLDSPRYGERWGRHWLDVARYADTKGYAYDREERRFVHSSGYRDWVIRALNEDLPYDRFLQLQLAADRLVGEDGDRRDLAAMGFLTVGRRFVNNIHDIIDDRIDVVMRGTQALTAACARCHDHKFDPIPTKDYYSLYGVFACSSEKTVPLEIAPEETPARLAYRKELGAREEKLRSTFQAKREELSERLRGKAAEYLLAVLEVDQLPTEEFYAILGPDDLNPVIVRQWAAYLYQTSKSFHPVFAIWNALAALPRGEFADRAGAAIERCSAPGGSLRINPRLSEAFAGKPPASLRETAERYGKVLAGVHARWREALKSAAKSAAPPAAQPDALPDAAEEEIRLVLYGPDSPAAVPPGAISEIEWFFDEPTRVELSKLQAEIDRWNLSSPGAPGQAVILTDRAALRNSRVFLRGNPARRGEEAPRQYLLALSGGKREPFRDGSGRLELARAITRRDNPLTARVMVNRVWLHHFGAGLVTTPSDFGSRSDPPSHPELLDWLALRFIEDGWSLKRLHCRIMTSSVYRQDSRSEGSPGAKLDPENRLLWRMNRRRLDFEGMRDSLLASSGELDLTMGGRPVDLTASPAVPRRTVWGFVDRQFLPDYFRVFDFANPDQHSPFRHATTVPQQALYFLNSPFVIGRARALAARIETRAELEAGDPAERIRRLYRILFQRDPNARELEAGRSFLGAARPAAEASPPPRVTAWRYGYGEFDETAARVKSFEPLPHFTGEAWQGGPAWPDPKLGWVQLKADGGHVGNDLQHAAIRRWIAPRSGVASIQGKVAHAHQEGDGVRPRIISSRAGILWNGGLVHQKSVEAAVAAVELKEGESIDFVVDLGGNLSHDDFTWAPVIRLAGTAAGGPTEWDSKREFAGPAPPIEPLSALESYAQALLFSNEFTFVD